MSQRLATCMVCRVQFPAGVHGTPPIRCKEHRLIFPGTARTLTVAQWERLLAVYDGGCAYCGMKDGKPRYLGADHVIPRSRGGEDDVTNIVPACPRCNAMKCDLLPLEYIAWQHGLCKRRDLGAHAIARRALAS